jgi:cystathionine gamma-synthase
LADALAELEGGFAAVVTSSGMSAVALVLQLLEPGDLLIAPHDCYGGTYRAMASLAERGRFRVAFVDQSDAAALERAFERNPRMLWVETPSNPLLRITDLAHAAALARAHGALLVADNTFLTPLLQQPIDHGADIVVHSTTKYLGGHSDVIGGAVVTHDDEVAGRVRFLQNAIGGVPGPWDVWLVLRGLKTLAARMRVHCDNARAVVSALQDLPAVREILWPGLGTHRGHDVAARQMRDFGGMVAFRMADEQAALAACGRFEVFTLAESLGGVESLVEHPGRMTHQSVAGSPLEVPGDLIRLSVGIEDADDLVADIRKAVSGM